MKMFWSIYLPLLFCSGIAVFIFCKQPISNILEVIFHPLVIGMLIFLYINSALNYGTEYRLYSDQMEVRFPLQPVCRLRKIKFEDIEKVNYLKINSLDVPSSFRVDLKSSNKKYNFSFRGNESKMKELLRIMENNGVSVKYQFLLGGKAIDDLDWRCEDE